MQFLWTVVTSLLKNAEHGIEDDIDDAYSVCIPIPEVKKNICIDQWLGEYCIWGKSEQSQAFANKFGLFQIQLGGLGEVPTPGKFCHFFPI